MPPSSPSTCVVSPGPPSLAPVHKDHRMKPKASGAGFMALSWKFSVAEQIRNPFSSWVRHREGELGIEHGRLLLGG